MAEEAVKFGLTQEFKSSSSEKKVFGVTTATVINNIDCTGEGRVQLMLSWLPGYLPWARMSTPMAGMGRGTYFIPQIGDEVIVAFNHGDVREPYVMGTTWNTIDKPPALTPNDPVTTRKIRTPLGHELAFDEAQQSVTLTSNTMSKVTLDPTKAEISTPTAKVSVSKDGDVTITAAKTLKLSATIIEISADAQLTIKSGGNATFKASGICAVQGSKLNLN